VNAGTGTPQEWLIQRERSNRFLLRLAVRAALWLGRPLARPLLYPVCIYFLVFSPRARAASRQYLNRVLGRAPRLSDLFRHYHTFAAVLLDRVFLLSDRSEDFDIRVHGEAIVAETLSSGQGCFLLSAHLGSLEVARALGRTRPSLRVSMVMYEENARKVRSALESINPQLAQEVISLGRIDSMLQVKDSLERGEFVGMLADRTLEEEGRTQRPFLGAPAAFPLGPFRLAAMLRRPIVLMVGLYGGGWRYDVHFEPLADLSAVPDSQRSEAVELALSRYVERLEHYCRMAPCNWFNFYDFWK
jgi:predicted LPLAT superfamily acyltransferase